MDHLPDADVDEDIGLESEDIEHSVLGASSSSRWMACPGSIGLTAKLRNEGEGLREAGEAARLGTAAHTLAAACLNANREPWEFCGQKIDDFTVDKDMASAVQVYTDYNFVEESKAEIAFTEFPLNSESDPDAFGTADRVLFKPAEYIHIIDYKHGAGIVVEPESSQLKYYGQLAYEKRPDFMRGDGEPKFIHMTIVQPRIPHPRGVIRTHTMTPQALTAWWEGEVVPAMKATRDPNALLHTGAHCIFCPARDHCPAFKKEVLEFNTTGLQPEYLTDEELGDQLIKVKAILAYGEGLKTEALKRAIDGRKVRNFKLVHKRANRVWKAEAETALVKLLGNEAYEPRKLRSPAQMEQVAGGKAAVVEWAFKPTTGYTLAPETDKRAEVSLRVDYYGDLSGIL